LPNADVSIGNDTTLTFDIAYFVSSNIAVDFLLGCQLGLNFKVRNQSPRWEESVKLITALQFFRFNIITIALSDFIHMLGLVLVGCYF